jgi:hypothetical protein
VRILLACLAALLAGCASHATVEHAKFGGTTGAVVDLSMPSLEGGDMSFAQFRGKIAVVHFIDVGSLAAQLDLEDERKLRGDPGVALVEVALDVSGYKLVQPWANGAGVDWPVMLATDELRAGSTPFGAVNYTPTTVILDKDGRIAWAHVGAMPRGLLARVVKSL